MLQIPDSWTPTGNTLDHNGQPLTTGRNFFAPPPPEIGTVLSAYSALKVGQSPHPVRKRLRVTLAVALAAALLGFVAAAASEPKGFVDFLETGAMVAAVFAIPAAILAFLLQYLFRRDYRCDYVGAEGVADYDLLDMRRGTPGQILRFQDAADLKITLTPQHIKGIQAATAYDYCWVDANGKKIFSIFGEYYTEKKLPEDKFHFAAAAEAAWWEYQRVLRLALVSQTAPQQSEKTS